MKKKDNYPRILNKIIERKFSFFLFGPRQTGKTTLLNSFKSTLEIDLLNNEIYLKYNSKPDILFEEVQIFNKNSTKEIFIWIDEIQKIPELLETVHRILNNFDNVIFALTGSSARKIKRGAANLLGGRLLDYKIHPLSFFEIEKDFNLGDRLQFGSLPHIVKLDNKEVIKKFLRSYISTYLTEEIKSESLVKNLSSFQGFLELVASNSSKQINITDICTKIGISRHYINKYFEILEDTLVGFFLYPYCKGTTKRLSKQPKFYFFDTGATRAINRTLNTELKNEEKGNIFEQFIVLEIKKLIDYYNEDYQIFFYRTAAGAEVDILLTLNNEIKLAIECKSNPKLLKSDLSGIKSFSNTYKNVETVIVTDSDYSRIYNNLLEVLTVKDLLYKIKKIISYN